MTTELTPAEQAIVRELAGTTRERGRKLPVTDELRALIAKGVVQAKRLRDPKRGFVSHYYLSAQP
jgi:hypothetical protein